MDGAIVRPVDSVRQKILDDLSVQEFFDFIYRQSRKRPTDPVVIHEQWMKQLYALASTSLWRFIDASKVPTTMPMGLTFDSINLQNAFCANTANDKSYKEVMRSSDFRTEGDKHEVYVAKLPKVKPSQTLSPQARRNEAMLPAGLLHSFFAEYFDSLPARTEERDIKAKCYRMGASFLLADVLLHELAQCFHTYPEIKRADSRGKVTEAVFNEEEGNTLRGNGWDPECEENGARYLKPEHFMIPEFQDLVSYRSPEDWLCKWKDEKYKTTSEYYHFIKTLVPWEYISKWFQEEHWDEKRDADQLLAPPERLWTMRYELPCPTDQPLVDLKIVRAEIKAPEVEDQSLDSSSFDRAMKRDAEVASLEQKGVDKKKK
ncbi:hypothetical protein CC86DRAFT_402242 [Ophiobolus disseminans]|uniref:Uncharacterized protein n=1 Tax=Ophiobolus disseminans TaxID=1469910 RepID=A0A6A7AG99_9PLEO|nr:hypothetical protein CC86DRAFT_402242 [Ophiobolus disseminans]